MNIVIVGTGYVGLVTGTCFSEMGNRVTCIDVDENKINKLNKLEIPIYEPGLKEIIKNNLHKTLFFETLLNVDIEKADIIIIAVGTPMSENGSADLSAVYDVAKTIGKKILSHKIIVVKSTVPVGTCDKIKERIALEIKSRGKEIEFDIVSNPEFLKEGAAVNDFMKPDRVVIGADNEKVLETMKQLYSPFFRARERFVTMDIRSSEMTKYAANSMLATKISFINEMANICEKVGADINNVRIGIGSDTRIGYDFIYPGIGYGGTCFPKDISALINLSNQNGYNPKIISAVKEVNENQKTVFLNKIINRFGEDLTGLTFAVWGLSFKPETDDMRESPAVYVISELLKRGAQIKAYDPKAIEESKKVFIKSTAICYGKNKYEVVENVDALILLTEWKEFRSPDFNKLEQLMKKAIVFDGRNQYNNMNLNQIGFEYYQVGK